MPPPLILGGLKTRCVLDNVVPGGRAEPGELLFGNIDAYLFWKLTGGPQGGIRII
jgi:glycerol kinase